MRGSAATGTARSLEPVFRALRAILERQGDLYVQADTPREYYLETLSHSHPSGRRMMFAAVRIGARYVSFHLMPAYACPEIAARISPALKKRMQGKACFNFTKPDPELFAELEELTEAGREAFARLRWL